MLRFFCFAFLLSFGSSWNIEAAEIFGQVEEIDGEKVANIIVIGGVEQGDARVFEELLEEGARERIRIWGVKLFSRGGSVSEALKIGRLIRSSRLVTTAPNMAMVGALKRRPDGSCYTMDWFDINVAKHHWVRAKDDNCICASACALIWMGGIRRNNDVALHHPYLGVSNDEDLRFSDHEVILDATRRDVAAYLAEMRVPSKVFERMFSTPSPRLDLLSAEEESLDEDKVYGEFVVSKCGDKPTMFDDLVPGAEIQRQPDDWRNSYDELMKAYDELMKAYNKCRRAVELDVQSEAQFGDQMRP